jgi:glutamyl/glutaminyl-tRNA synthetase
MAVKTRFAPSPTGFLHIGGARTALFSWLFARKHAGKFVLRIEDTDQVRSTAESAAGILQDMLWLGLNWDEGPVVGGQKNQYFQSERLSIYNRYLDQLIAANRAYEAYETPAQLAAMRAEADKAKKPFRYRRNMPGRVLEKQAGVNPVLRFEMPYKDITLDDLVLGPVTVKADEHDDIVIRKSDGFPTYHFAVVIDDHEMGITHVLRAQEHLMNTFKHIGLYEAFTWTPPHHGHLPLVFNMDSTKMSKREKAKSARAALQANVQKGGAKDYSDVAAKAGVTLDEITPFMAKKNDDANLAAKLAAAVGTKVPEIDVQDFRRSGYLPEALLNFIALVGWAPGEDREIITQQQMIELFSVEGIGKTNGRFDRKKLEWMNGEYIRKSSIDHLLEVTKLFLAVTDYPLKTASDATLRELLAMYQERMPTLSDMAENARFFFEEPQYDRKAIEKHIKNNNGLDYLKQIQEILTPITTWTKESLAEPMERVLSIGEKKGAAAQALRVAVSGGPVSPPMLETVALLGREKTLGRIERMLS